MCLLIVCILGGLGVGRAVFLTFRGVSILVLLYLQGNHLLLQ